MPKDPNAKIRKDLSKLAKKKSTLMKDKFSTDDEGLRKIWDAEIKKIDLKMMELQSKLK